MNRIMYILCGAQGSGKSMTANEIKNNEKYFEKDKVILSIDDYWTNNGKYRYKDKDLFMARKWNIKRTEQYAIAQYDIIIIDDTNVSSKERMGYIKIGEKYGYKIKLVEPKNYWIYNVDECFKKNLHMVSEETIYRNIKTILIDKKEDIYHHWAKYSSDD